MLKDGLVGMRLGGRWFRVLGRWKTGLKVDGSINYDTWLHIYRPECSRSASDLDGLFQCWRGGALRWYYAMLAWTCSPAKMARVIMTGTALEPVNNQKTKVAANYKILFWENRTTFKYQSSKGENIKRNKKKEKRRSLVTNVFSPTSTITNLICYLRCVRRGFICKAFYLFL